MFARLGFAIAVNVDPDVLLVDEVLAVGDQSFQARCIDRMLEFRDAGKTLVLVTHDLGAVESFCERAIWIDRGARARGRAAAPRDPRLRGRRERAGRGAVGFARQRASRAARSRRTRPTHESHPVHLTSMSFTSLDGAEREVFHTGEPMRVRISYTATVEQPDPSASSTSSDTTAFWSHPHRRA